VSLLTLASRNITVFVEKHFVEVILEYNAGKRDVISHVSSVFIIDEFAISKKSSQ
jgi:hypothetical protein